MSATADRLFETPDRDGAYPRLAEAQLQQLEGLGKRRRTHVDEVLFREGDPQYDFYVVLDGKVAVIDGYETPEQRLIAVHGARRFLGELGLLTGQAAFFTTVVSEAGEVLVVPVTALRALVTEDAVLGDLLIRAYFARRELLIDLGVGLRIVGSPFSPDTRRLREFVARNRIPHRWVDLEQDAAAEAFLQAAGLAPEATPVVIWHRHVMRNPSNEELAAAIGLASPSRRVRAVSDLLIVGAGPSGLAASVYGASEGLDTVALDAVATGGQAGTSSRIENYLGFPSGISGAELGERATLQARKFGASIFVPAEVVALEPGEGHHLVRLADGEEQATRTVIVASGARYRKLDVERLEEFEGTSVYYAATPMEARLCAGDPIVIVGGGNSAGQATLFLSRHVPELRLLVRGDSLTASMSRYLADRIERSPVEVLLHTEIRELEGEGVLESVIAEDNRSGERRRLPAKALFVFIGADPHSDWLAGHVALDRNGFVLTGRAAASSPLREADSSDPLLLETSCPGVLAVGDVRSGSIKRVASAVGEGSMAVRLVHDYLERSQQHPHHVP